MQRKQVYHLKNNGWTTIEPFIFGVNMKWLSTLKFNQGSHSTWKSGKTWKMSFTFSSQGKVREFDKNPSNQGIWLAQETMSPLSYWAWAHCTGNYIKKVRKGWLKGEKEAIIWLYVYACVTVHQYTTCIIIAASHINCNDNIASLMHQNRLK